MWWWFVENVSGVIFSDSFFLTGFLMLFWKCS
jgi:hypothetical protein